MSISERGRIVLFCLFAFVAVASWQVAAAQQDVAHLVSGFVKHVDHDAKTMVVKTTDGSEHTIKWTGDTAWEGTKDAGKDIKEGTKVSIKYTEKGGEKTAVGVKDISKDAAKAVK
jgi:Cu/Ag efflux protein CusF